MCPPEQAQEGLSIDFYPPRLNDQELNFLGGWLADRAEERSPELADVLRQIAYSERRRRDLAALEDPVQVEARLPELPITRWRCGELAGALETVYLLSRMGWKDGRPNLADLISHLEMAIVGTASRRLARKCS